MRAKLTFVVLCSSLSLVLTSPGPVPAGKLPARLGRIDPGLRSIPVKIYRNFLVVAEGRIGPGSGRLNFILDTGTAPSIIDATIVRQFGLSTRPSTLRSLGETKPVQTAIVPEIDLGPIHAVSVPVQVQSLARLEREFGVAIAGIIGMDLLSRASFRLDYDKKKIEFTEPLGFGGAWNLGIPVHFDARSAIAIADVTIDGRNARMLVDSGSDRVVLFGGNFSEDMDWLAPRSTSQSGASLVDPKMRIQVFPASNIILGGQHFSEERAYLVPGSADPAFDGVLGVRALGFRSLSYDAGCETVYLQK